MVELEGVRFSYGGGGFSLAVDALSIGRGEHAAFIGPSGCGKTTLVNLIAGIEVPRAGTVRVGGDVVSRLGDSERRSMRIRRIGMVFQAFELLEYLTAMENILLPYHVSGALRLTREVRERAGRLAGACGISHTLGRLPDRLSQGERQRVAICRALVTEPELVICDEPTGNLDPESGGAIVDLLFEQAESRGATLLMVTHDHGLLGRFGRVVDMRGLLVDGG